MSHYDIIIVGSGIVGMTAALALAQKTSLNIALLDAKPISPEWQKEKYAQRVSAISLASQRLFQHLHVWEAIQAKRISPYQEMRVWDAHGEGEIHFDSASVHVDTLGYIVEDDVMRAGLFEKIQTCSNITVVAPCQLAKLEETPGAIVLSNTAGETLTTQLLIAADGGNSWVREQAAIELTCKDYAHTAIVATVQTAFSHQRTAWQRFASTGPLAFLPLAQENTCSIVWSVLPAEAEKILALDDESFQKRLAQEFSYKLGDITATTERLHFPLQMRHVKNYVKSRMAFIGDAAHTLHPLAGQGVNLGLLDAACLVDVVVTAVTKQRDFASLATLRRYERWRKADNAAMLAVVAGLKQLFASESVSVQRARNFGLQVTNQLKFVKNCLVNYALGNRGELPTLMN